MPWPMEIDRAFQFSHGDFDYRIVPWLVADDPQPVAYEFRVFRKPSDANYDEFEHFATRNCEPHDPTGAGHRNVAIDRYLDASTTEIQSAIRERRVPDLDAALPDD